MKFAGLSRDTTDITTVGYLEELFWLSGMWELLGKHTSESADGTLALFSLLLFFMFILHDVWLAWVLYAILGMRVVALSAAAVANDAPIDERVNFFAQFDVEEKDTWSLMFKERSILCAYQKETWSSSVRRRDVRLDHNGTCNHHNRGEREPLHNKGSD